MDRNPPITKINYNPCMTFWMCGRKLLFPKRSIKMIDGSKECKCQLASELQDLRVFEKRSKEEVTQSKNAIENQNRICEYIILSNGPLICKKKIQFTTTNTFYFFVIFTHASMCALCNCTSRINENNLSFINDVHDDQRVGSGNHKNFINVVTCIFCYFCSRRMSQ